MPSHADPAAGHGVMQGGRAPPLPTEVEEECDECDAVFPDGVLGAPSSGGAKEWRLTSRGCKISTESALIGLSRILMKENCVVRRRATIRADLCNVTVGSYVVVNEGAVLLPPWKIRRGQATYLPLKIGNYVLIGKGSTVEAAQLATTVVVGDGAVIGRGAVVRECVMIDPGSVVPPESTLPPYTRWAGDPATQVGRLHEGAQHDIMLLCKMAYSQLIISSG
eukprot:TRINITY_DN17403_c0_g1_i1.p1 TRINITY_DN17403_c0_g1~~TRINITY_DN17403_c0_g1_i1.p1  ORF type:complete len:222 (+),score=54.04 TRINITY_DN17403_c0_g1_i1:308-973(+)